MNSFYSFVYAFKKKNKKKTRRERTCSIYRIPNPIESTFWSTMSHTIRTIPAIKSSLRKNDPSKYHGQNARLNILSNRENEQLLLLEEYKKNSKHYELKVHYF